MHLAVRLPSDNSELCSLYQAFTRAFVQNAKVHPKYARVHFVDAPMCKFTLKIRAFLGALFTYTLLLAVDLFINVGYNILNHTNNENFKRILVEAE